MHPNTLEGMDEHHNTVAFSKHVSKLQPLENTTQNDCIWSVNVAEETR